MGKYMRKSKVTGGGGGGSEVAVMEAATAAVAAAQSCIGVRTRAKTLALQRLQMATPPPPSMKATASTTASNTDTNNSVSASASSSCFHLRSRKLEKPPSSLLVVTRNSSKKQSKDNNNEKNPNPNPTPKLKLRTSPRFKFVVGGVNSCSNNNDEQDNNHNQDGEPSFGENVLEIEQERDRSTRETTPCSLMRDPENTRTPGSSTNRRTNSVRNPMRRILPTTHEMDEFFAVAEEEEQVVFKEKYNFDPVNDLPLPGRYEWVRVDM